MKTFCPFKQKPLEICLKILLLLKNVMHNQSRIQLCPIRADDGGFPNLTTNAGSAFFFNIPFPVTPGHMERFKLSLANDDNTLPSWMVFRRQSLTLAGLALTEDCGLYHLKVSVIDEKCAAYFYLTILNITVTDEDPVRNTLTCSEGEMIIWANLLLQLSPMTLSATQRLRLVSTMARYLNLPVGFVYMFSGGKFFIRQKNLRVCGDKAGAAEKPAFYGNVAELLWPVSCEAEERLSDLVKTLERSVETGRLERLLETTVLEWRLFCEPGGVQHKVKRDVQIPKVTLALNETTQDDQTVTLTHSHSFLPFNLEPSLSAFSTHSDETTGSAVNSLGNQISLQVSSIQADTSPASKIKAVSFSKQVSELTSDTSFSVPEYVRITDIFPSPFLPEHAPTVRRLFWESTADTSPSTFSPHSIYPSLLPTPVSDSVTFIVTHEAFDGVSQATRLTPRPCLKETTMWTECYRANHTDSERQPTVSSQGHITVSQEPKEDLSTVNPPLHSLPFVSDQPLTEKHDDILLLSSTESAQTSNEIPATQLCPDVSPTSYLVTEQLSITQQTETVQHLSAAPSGTNEDVMSQLIVTAQGVSSTTSAGQLTLSGQMELESSLTASYLKPSLTMFTPALPSYHPYSEQLETPNTTVPVFSVERTSPSLISLLQTFSESFLSDTGVSWLQQGLQNTVLTESNSAANGQTFISGIFLTSLQPVQMSLPFTKIPQTVLIPLSSLEEQYFEEQASFSVTHERTSFMSVKQTLVHSLQLEESQQSNYYFRTSLIPGMTTSVYLNTTGVTTIKQGQSVTSLVPVSISMTIAPMSGNHFNPTTPSSGQEPYTTSSIELRQSIEPSFPLCGQSVEEDLMRVSECTPSIQSTSLDSIKEHSLNFLTSDFPGEKQGTASQYQFLIFSSSGQFFSSLRMGSIFSMITYMPSLSEGFASDRGQSPVQPSGSSSFVSNSMNLPPKVLQSIPVLVATVGFPFLYSIPSETFVDPEDGEADALSLEIRLIEGPPLSVGTWLALDGLTLHGVPLEEDLHFAPQQLLLVARDRQDLSTTLPVTVDLRRNPVEPCHIFTLTAQRSLHSILRHRHVVDLLLIKLSLFFNSSSSRHLSVVSMMPGSTVVSWYNYSLCKMAQIKITHCQIEKIHSMGLAMRSPDGSVNPEFRKVMLPEFPIIKVQPVHYEQECFSTTPSSTFGTSDPAGSGTNASLTTNCGSASTTPTLQQTNTYQSMAGMFIALLVVCILILIILLIVTVLHFRKGHGSTTTVAIWPPHHLLSGQSRDLWALGPRRPPLFEPELPPPPLQLWIDLQHEDERPLPVKPRTKNF